MNRRAALAALLALVGAFLVIAPAADAVSAPTSAWWSRLATTNPTNEVPAGLPVPAPTTPDTVPVGATVPEGNLLVEGTAEGATAVAAIRFDLADGESSPSLTLPIGEGSSVNTTSIILACRAATAWTPPESSPGKWDDKPLVEGFGCINGVVAEDLATVTFGVQPLVSGTVLDVVLVPGEEPALERPPGVPEPPVDANRSAFRWIFEVPTAKSLEVVAGSDFEEGAGNRTIVPTPSETPEFGAAEPTTDSPPPVVDSSPAFEAPAEPATPALDPQDVAAPQPAVTDAVPAVARNGPANRTIGFILLALSAAVAAWAYFTSPAGGTIGLGRFAAPASAVAPALVAPGEGPVGGLSRFARPRSMPPTRLS